MGEHAVLRFARRFLARHRESVEDTIEAWDMAMDDNFRNMIGSRLQEMRGARAENVNSATSSQVPGVH